MKLDSIDVLASPRTPNHTRLQATVSYSRRKRETLWYDVPAAYEERLMRSGTPWLAALLPWAAVRNERLTIDAPVDPVLLENAHEVLRIWRSWPGRRGHVELDCPRTEVAAADEHTAVLFTCGVDSFYTLLHAPVPVTRLITVHGFDLALGATDSFDRLAGRAKSVAQEVGAELIPVATNLLESAWRESEYARLSHGPALLSIALMFSPARILLASSHHNTDTPWGSHPRTDPLFSTSATEVVHHGFDRSRAQKTEVIATSETAMRQLRVCLMSGTDQNCGDCEKCYRTMLTLYLLGALDRCETFAPDALDLDRVPQIYVGHHVGRLFAREVRDLAARVGNRRVEADLTAALKRSERLRRRIDRLHKIPLLRLGVRLERSVRRDSVS